jgi:hypothetical protein
MHKKISKVLIVSIIILFSLSMLQAEVLSLHEAKAQIEGPIRDLFIHEYVDWTYLAKPIVPVYLSANKILPGQSYKFICNLRAGAKYHVYFYGDWIETSPQANKTDYDIYVYNPLGQLESMHTESAGLPEHLGTTVEAPFFIPQYSGNYTILIKNDLKESKGSEAGTLMIIEHLDCNHWYELYVKGKVNNKPIPETYWAYEFVTTSERVNVIVEVPDPPEAYLDMYETQLYLMANPADGEGTFLNGMPLPDERALYGDIISGIYGGYRLDYEGLNHINASASCEFYGQDMNIDYTFSGSGGGSETEQESETARQFLYHLALIAEEGEGTIRFMFKTDFVPPSLNILNPVDSAYSSENVDIVANASDDATGLQSVLLNYTVNNWRNWITLEMTPSEDNIYTGTIPMQPGGITVKYRVTATDGADNVASQEGSYIVKERTDMTITPSTTYINAGESVRISGWISHTPATVTLDFVCQDTHDTKTTTANATGYFSYDYTPEKAGVWTVIASWPGDEKCYPGATGPKILTVEKITTTLTCNIGLPSVILGESLDVSGFVLPAQINMKVIVSFTRPNGTLVEREVYTSSDGSYETIGFIPDAKGQWRVQAFLEEDNVFQSSSSNQKVFIVSDTWLNEYKMYIIATAGAAVAIAFGVILFSRRRESYVEEE